MRRPTPWSLPLLCLLPIPFACTDGLDGDPPQLDEMTETGIEVADEADGPDEGACVEPAAACAALLECLTVLQLDAEADAFEAGGPCWCDGPEQASACASFCDDQLALAGATYPAIEACGGPDEGGSNEGGSPPNSADPTTVVGANLLWTSSAGDIPRDLAFSPDGSVIARAGWDGFDGDVAIHAVDDGALVLGPLATSWVNPAVRWSGDGRLATGPLTTDAGYQIFASDGSSLAVGARCLAKRTTALAWHPSLDALVVGTETDVFSPPVCVDQPGGDRLAAWSIPDGDPIYDAAWNDAGDRLAVLGMCTVQFYDAGFELVGSAALNPGYCSSGRLAWRPGSDELVALIATEGSDFAAFFADDRDGHPPLVELPSRRDLAFSPDGGALATIDDRGTVRIRDMATFDVTHQFAAHAGLSLSLAWSDDGDHLATGGQHPRVAVWELERAP